MTTRSVSISLKTPLKRYLLAVAMATLAFSTQAKEAYTVVVQDIDYYPIYRADPSTGSHSGYVRELMDAFARHQGIRSEYRVRPIRRMTMAGRVTAFNLAVPVAEYHFHKLGAEGRFVPAPKLMPQIDSHYHLSTLKHPDLINAFDRFLQQQQATVDALLQRYDLK